MRNAEFTETLTEILLLPLWSFETKFLFGKVGFNGPVIWRQTNSDLICHKHKLCPSNLTDQFRQFCIVVILCYIITIYRFSLWWLNDYAFPLVKEVGELMEPVVVCVGANAVYFIQQNLNQWRTEQSVLTELKKRLFLQFAGDRIRAQFVVTHWFPSQFLKLYLNVLYFMLIVLLLASEDIRF